MMGVCGWGFGGSIIPPFEDGWAVDNVHAIF